MAKRSESTPRPGAAGASSGIESAVVVEVGEGGPGRVLVRPSAAGRRGEIRPARVAMIAGYRPSPGDRVLTAREGDDCFVIGVIHAAAPPALALADGATAAVEGDAIEVKDPAGRVLVRYRDGVAEIAPPAGDLRLSAPQGRVVVEAAMDVSIEGGRDVVHRAGRRVDLAAGVAAGDAPQVRIEPGAARVQVAQVDVTAKSSRLVTGKATVLARTLATTAEEVAVHVARYELTATRLVEKARDAFRDVADLAQSRIGRARTIVKDVHSVSARRNVMVSKEDTSIDGKKILLG
jgi:hypothetical protein